MVAPEAESTARGLPGRTVVGLAKERMLPTVLDWMADVFQDNAQVLQGVLLNKQTDVDTLVRLAGSANEAQCELIAANQVRLVQSPALIKALYLNRNLRASTADRMIDFCVREGVDLSSLPNHEQIVAAIQQTEVATDAAEAQAQDAAFQQVQAALEGVSETEAEALHEAMSADRAEDGAS